MNVRFDIPFPRPALVRVERLLATWSIYPPGFVDWLPDRAFSPFISGILGLQCWMHRRFPSTCPISFVFMPWERRFVAAVPPSVPFFVVPPGLPLH